MSSSESDTNRDPGLLRASQKRFCEIILVVPFFGSEPHQLTRHVDLFNALGFDVFLVNLQFNYDWSKLPISSKMNFGLKHIWADQIESVLNSLQGDKIIFSLSNPTAGAIEAIARRRANDVKALICDSGPSKQVLKSILRLYTKEKPLPFLPWNIARSSLDYLMISPSFSKDLDSDLAQFPKDFPILSIRGWRDNVIPSSYIDEVFEPHPHLAWQKLGLPEAEHLNGLRDYPEEYTPPVKKFLEAHATKLQDSE